MTTSRIVIAGFLGVALLSSCELAEEGDAATGADASAASTTIATAPVSVIVESYDAETLDGRVVTIRAGEGALSSFTEGVPSEMHAVQLLAEAGNCEQISSTGDLWASLADETDEGLKASAFAKRAYDVHTFIKCAPNEPGGEAPAHAPQNETDPRFDTCGDVNDAGLGPYVQGVDPEYDWYRDGDNDGTNCEPSWFD